MAQSLWDKVRTGVLGKMHKLVDDNIANTPEAYTQRIRDLEAALADIRAAKDEAAGSVNGYRRQVTKLEGSKAIKQADIDLLLGDDDESNDEHALELQMELEGVDGQVAQLQDLLNEAEANKAALDKAIDQLETKHKEMKNALNRISLSSAAAKAKNRASAAAEAAVAASEAAEGASVDSIEAKINHDRDVADARFERVVGGLDSGTSPERAAALARAKQALEARRAAIAKEAVQQDASPVGAAT